MTRAQVRATGAPLHCTVDGLTLSKVKKMKARMMEEIHTEDIKIYQIPEAKLRDSVSFTVCGANSAVGAKPSGAISTPGEWWRLTV